MADNNNGNLQAIQYLVNEYGSIEKIPLSLLRKNGFNSALDAKKAFDARNITTGSGLSSKKQNNAVIPNLVKNIGKGILNIGLSNVAGTVNDVNNKVGLPGIPNNSLAIGRPGPGNAVAPSAATAAVKDDYAAQYGPNSPVQHAASNYQPGSAPPIAGGVQYGTTANGSILGAPVGNGVSAGGVGDTGLFTPGDAPNYQDYLNNIPKSGGYVPVPVAPKPVPFHMNDFTPQAAGMTATAYSPAFQAIDLAKQNAKANIANSQAIVTGVYQDLGKDIGANADALDAKYAAAKTATQADIKAAEAATQAPQAAAQAMLAAGMRGAGQGKYIQQVNAQGNADAAWRVGQLAQQGLNATTAQSANNLSADKANTGLQNAAATQGSFARQQLAFDLANTLSGYDQNKLNLSSQEALKTLDLAQQLTGTDLQLQQGNYGMTQDYYKNQLDAANAQNQMAFNTQQMNYNQANTAYQNAYNTWHDTAQLGYQQQQLGLQEQQIANQQSQFDASLVEKKYASDNTLAGMIARADATAAGKAATASGPYGQFASYVASIVTPNGQLLDPTKASQVMDAVNNVAQVYVNQGIKPKSAQDFVSDAVNYATANGLDPTTMRAAAYAYLGSGAATGWPGAKQLGSVPKGS